ncbi:hypothetical protein KIPB_012976, partial [Kipferlia bialata]|eukprot:g12976.t1
MPGKGPFTLQNFQSLPLDVQERLLRLLPPHAHSGALLNALFDTSTSLHLGSPLSRFLSMLSGGTTSSEAYGLRQKRAELMRQHQVAEWEGTAQAHRRRFLACGPHRSEAEVPEEEAVDLMALRMLPAEVKREWGTEAQGLVNIDSAPAEVSHCLQDGTPVHK